MSCGSDSGNRHLKSVSCDLMFAASDKKLQVDNRWNEDRS